MIQQDIVFTSTTDFQQSLQAFCKRRGISAIEGAMLVQAAVATPESGVIVVDELRTVRVKQLSSESDFLIYHFDDLKRIVLLDRIEVLDLSEERKTLLDLDTLAKLAGPVAILLRLLDMVRKMLDG